MRVNLRAVLRIVGLLSAFLLLGLAASSFAAGTTKSLVGIVGDITCGREHSMMRGMSDAQCTRECVARLGSKYALITEDQVFVLEGHWQEVDQLAGQKAKITGEVEGQKINVSKVEKF
jgi:hypothetical protein